MNRDFVALGFLAIWPSANNPRSLRVCWVSLLKFHLPIRWAHVLPLSHTFKMRRLNLIWPIILTTGGICLTGTGCKFGKESIPVEYVFPRTYRGPFLVILDYDAVSLDRASGALVLHFGMERTCYVGKKDFDDICSMTVRRFRWEDGTEIPMFVPGSPLKSNYVQLTGFSSTGHTVTIGGVKVLARVEYQSGRVVP